MSEHFDKLLLKGIRQGQMPGRTKEARTWFRDSAKKIRNVNRTEMLKSDVERLKSRPLLGNCYLYYYDAKWKDKLPYWDKFPIVFPFKKVKGGFYGINLHYLPYNYRAKLMDALYELASNDRFDENTKLAMNYKILNSASKYKYFKPCVKHYLTNHMRSKPMLVYPSEWDIALFMPLQQFQKATSAQVWRDSRRIIKG